MAEETKPKDPMSYTDIELEAMRLDKKCSAQYHGVMKLRRKIIRAKKAEHKAKQERIPTGEEIDRIRRDSPKDYNALVKKLGKAYAEKLKHNLASSTLYPPDTIRDWRMTIRAIERGIWHPTTPQMGPWRAPKQKNAYDKFMSS